MYYTNTASENEYFTLLNGYQKEWYFCHIEKLGYNTVFLLA